MNEIKKMEKKATFKVIYFPKTSQFAAIAWNYQEGVLISTCFHASYTEARQELDDICKKFSVKLQWFDGEYECGSDEQLYPRNTL